MVTMAQVEHGIAKYLDTELMPHLENWKQWIAGTYITIALQNGKNVVNKLKESDYVKALNIIDSEDNVDIDTIYSALLEQSKKCPATINLPMIGQVTLRTSDIDKIYNLIKETN